MTNQKIPEIFADGIINVSHANGVFRITFAQQEAEGVVSPAVKLMIPASQIGPVIKSLGNAVDDIAEKVKKATESDQEGDAGFKPNPKPKTKTRSRTRKTKAQAKKAN